MCHCSALRLFAFHACGKGLRWSTPREHEHVEALARYSSQLEQWKTRSARQIQRVNLLKVVQPLVWRLLGLHKIQMQVEVKKTQRRVFQGLPRDDINPWRVRLESAGWLD